MINNFLCDKDPFVIYLGKPLLVVHGWPGSVWEFYKMIPMLTDPVSYGGKDEDAFEVIAASIPGYGYSEAPHRTGTQYGGDITLYCQKSSCVC